MLRACCDRAPLLKVSGRCTRPRRWILFSWPHGHWLDHGAHGWLLGAYLTQISTTMTPLHMVLMKSSPSCLRIGKKNEEAKKKTREKKKTFLDHFFFHTNKTTAATSCPLLGCHRVRRWPAALVHASYGSIGAHLANVNVRWAATS